MPSYSSLSLPSFLFSAWNMLDSHFPLFPFSTLFSPDI